MQGILVRLILTTTILGTTAGTVSSQESKAAGFFKFMGKETVDTFRQVKHDKEWAAVVGITGSALTTDLVTSCRGFNRGLRETNLLAYGSTSCGQVVAIGVTLQVAGWVGTHILADWLEEECLRDNQAPEQWKHGNARSCRHVQLAGLLSAPLNATAAYGNECVINGGCVIHVMPKSPLIQTVNKK
jgi:hypothetical protein